VTPLAAAPGDILAVVGGGLGGWLVDVGQAIAGRPSRGTHVVVVTHQDAKNRWMGIQGHPGGVGLVDCTPFLNDARVRSNHAQPRANDRGQLNIFLASATKSLGLQYDWAGIAGDAANVVSHDLSAEIDRLWRWPTDTNLLPGHVVCSSLAAMLYDLMDVSWQHPGMGKERMCEPADWWNWNDDQQWLK
jgi:hypothetical protein